MDVKSVIRSLLPVASQSLSEAKNARDARTQMTSDRDANGKQEQANEESQRDLSQEEIDEAVQYLRGLAGVKENNLQVRVAVNDGATVVYIEDGLGKVVRRIPSTELALLTKNRQKSSGHLLNKAL